MADLSDYSSKSKFYDLVQRILVQGLSLILCFNSEFFKSVLANLRLILAVPIFAEDIDDLKLGAEAN